MLALLWSKINVHIQIWASNLCMHALSNWTVLSHPLYVPIQYVNWLSYAHVKGNSNIFHKSNIILFYGKYCKYGRVSSVKFLSYVD